MTPIHTRSVRSISFPLLVCLSLVGLVSCDAFKSTDKIDFRNFDVVASDGSHVRLLNTSTGNRTDVSSLASSGVACVRWRNERDLLLALQEEGINAHISEVSIFRLSDEETLSEYDLPTITQIPDHFLLDGNDVVYYTKRTSQTNAIVKYDLITSESSTIEVNGYVSHISLHPDTKRLLAIITSEAGTEGQYIDFPHRAISGVFSIEGVVTSAVQYESHIDASIQGGRVARINLSTNEVTTLVSASALNEMGIENLRFLGGTSLANVKLAAAHIGGLENQILGLFNTEGPEITSLIEDFQGRCAHFKNIE